MNYVIFIIQILFVPLLAPLVVGLTRKIKAKMQNRMGASVFQPYRNLRKLFSKDEIISDDASAITFIAPFVVLASMLTIGVIIPIIPISGIPAFVHGDFIVVISFIVLGTFFLALNGLDAGNAFGGLGSSREMTLAALTEAGLFFSLLPIALLAKSTDLTAMFTHASTLPTSETLVFLLAFVAFFIALLAENARYPFDNPSTHLELTMVHEAMIIEASGKRLGIFEWASASKLLIFILLGANVFLPWGVVVVDMQSMLLASIILISKIVILTTVIAVIESTTAKLRFFRLPDLLFTSFVFGLIALVLVVV